MGDQLIYNGAHDAVRIEDPELGVVGVVERGVPVTIGDGEGEIPSAVADSLLTQDTWTQPTKAAPVKKGDN